MSPAPPADVAVEAAGHSPEGVGYFPPIGKMGIWWFLSSEVITFGGLLAAYIVQFWGSEKVHEAATHLSLPIGAVNTLILLTSSLTMVLAFGASDRGDARATRKWLTWTVLFGLVFLAIKGFEWSSEISAGFTPGEGIFWSFYYGLTGLHGLHVLGGVVVNALLLFAVASRGLQSVGGRIEYAGLYWHFVDIVWIFLFPLLYLTE
jgi:heme/copper-type cytochrome/quinol oxidase subunit 3